MEDSCTSIFLSLLGACIGVAGTLFGACITYYLTCRQIFKADLERAKSELIGSLLVLNTQIMICGTAPHHAWDRQLPVILPAYLKLRTMVNAFWQHNLDDTFAKATGATAFDLVLAPVCQPIKDAKDADGGSKKAREYIAHLVRQVSDSL